MRWIIGIVIALGALWGGYWVAGSTALERGVEAAFQKARADGRVASYTALRVQGFPNRFDLSLHDVTLGAPGNRLVWHAPGVQLFALSYRPNRMIASLDGTQTLDLPGQKLSVDGQQIGANFNLAADTALSFDSLALVGDKLSVTSSAGWGATLKQARLAANRLAGPATYRFGAELVDIVPNPTLRARIDPKGALPDRIGLVHLEGQVTLSAPLDRHAGQTRPRATALALTDTRLDWGPVKATANGKLTVGANGVPEGRITLSVTHWQPLIDIAEAQGLIKPGVAPTWRNALAALAKGSGAPDTVSLPLSFHDGWMSLGPLPLGPAPRLAPAAAPS
ncbi:DUF2125 domain-containing protein [Acidimangrovimonas sediminis]|uniref:DUF2125 domain-containing protein n=1 Tax=Acidimangrovimonas sediminis TaxID=2056283 RepID=UPI000C8042B6|nr:DUF2125 domain-containing protein [Acidimangrovimonas sediminis]